MKTNIRILIADDYIDNRTLLKEIIEILGFEYELVENGKDALNALNRSFFNIILMDIEMPVMNGIEATKEIRKHADPLKKRTPIIAISAHNPEHFSEKFKQVGFNDYISKPYSIEKLIDIINKYG
jgi:CheY-like chemotaxis protein